MSFQQNTGSYAEAHSSPQGPGDARPTALQILQDNDRIGNMKDLTFFVTGGTAGMGSEIVHQLAKTGAHVFFTARDRSKAEKVVQDIAEEGKTNGSLQDAKVEWVVLDNSSLASVKAGAEDFLRRSDKLNVLICNAGISMTPYGQTKDGYEAQFGTNYLAHFTLFQVLKPLMMRSSTPSFNSRVIVVSSAAHTYSTVQFGNFNLDKPVQEPYDPFCEMQGNHNPMLLYGQSKTALIWFSNELDRRYGEKGLHSLSLHPGNVLTGGFGNVDSRVMEKLAPLMGNEEIGKTFKNVEQGAATVLFAAVGKEFEGKGGMYLDDCNISKPIPPDGQIGVNGYKEWAYNPAGEKRLWTEALNMVGLEDD